MKSKSLKMVGLRSDWVERGRGRVVVKMCEYEGEWGSIWRGGERGWGWEREVGIGGGRGVFWNFFFF